MNLHWASVFYGMDGAVGQICCIFLLLVLILLAGVESMDIFCASGGACACHDAGTWSFLYTCWLDQRRLLLLLETMQPCLE